MKENKESKMTKSQTGPSIPSTFGNNRHITIHCGPYLPCLAILTTKYLHIYTLIPLVSPPNLSQSNGQGQ